MYQPYEIIGADRAAPYLIVCDHARNTVPPFVGNGSLGVAQADMDRHIAYDVGAEGVSLRLAHLLGAPLILSNFSRLVIDPNRGEDDPTLVMRLYDGSVIPTNRAVTGAEIEERLNRCYRPYHQALEGLAAERPASALFSIHSFTPRLRGRELRPWQIGVLYGGENPLAALLINRLRDEPDLCVGDNEPYSGHLIGDTMDRHAVQNGRPHVLIELRNDLITTARDQEAWAERLAPVLVQAAADHIF